MRKILLAAALVLTIAAMQGCAEKRGLGFVNNALTYREDYGNLRAEVSAGVNVNNYFPPDSEYFNLPYEYKKTESGQAGVLSEAGIGIYYKLFSTDVFAVSGGVKYYDYLAYSYNYVYYYDRLASDSIYDYSENVRIDYFNSNKVSIIFPDVEIKLPFSDNLRLAANVELVYMRWSYSGGYYTSSYEVRKSQNAGITTPVDTFSYLAPGKVTAVNFGSGLFYLGSINLGVIYYF